MIRSYGDSRTRKFAAGQRIKQFEPIRRSAEKALDRLDAATTLFDVSNFPGHRLEKLKGERAGTYSIRINDQWRICFDWPDGSIGPENVTIKDYH
ncbi:MAG TPA: type II toxin-antitoxin system RelE/ParE family toxin [Alphaproteobacteria bacterium]|nr:type II toxin-antitoxin system RelE/ParE family toxin [Alphaproteobacteria bacterium]